jgi:hypothetical protein
MFEELQEEEKELNEMRKKQIWISAVIILALAVVGLIAYRVFKPLPDKTNLSAQSSAPVVKEASPDPVRDLQVVRAVMGKDVTGVRVVWSVRLRNKSAAYTYSNVQYEARFVRPDGSVLAASRGTIPCNLKPGDEQKIPDFLDGIYDQSAATYNFVLIGAKAESGE